MSKLNAGKASVLAIVATFVVSTFVLGKVFTTNTFADNGSIWTTNTGCGPQQNVNQYPSGAHIYINGSNFDAGSYNWNIKNPGANGTILISGSFVLNSNNSGFCVDGGTPPDGGPYQVNVGNKNDNFKIGDATPSATPTAVPSGSPTATPIASVTPTATPNGSGTPTVTPTATPTETTHNDNNDGLGCANHDCSGNSAPQGQVLGASTMAKTGSFDEAVYQAIMSIGATLSAIGIKGLKKAKKASTK